jgi:hypothetical protein
LWVIIPRLDNGDIGIHTVEEILRQIGDPKRRDRDEDDLTAARGLLDGHRLDAGLGGRDLQAIQARASWRWTLDGQASRAGGPASRRFHLIL